MRSSKANRASATTHEHFERLGAIAAERIRSELDIAVDPRSIASVLRDFFVDGFVDAGEIVRLNCVLPQNDVYSTFFEVSVRELLSWTLAD